MFSFFVFRQFHFRTSNCHPSYSIICSFPSHHLISCESKDMLYITWLLTLQYDYFFIVLEVIWRSIDFILHFLKHYNQHFITLFQIFRVSFWKYIGFISLYTKSILKKSFDFITLFQSILRLGSTDLWMSTIWMIHILLQYFLMCLGAPLQKTRLSSLESKDANCIPIAVSGDKLCLFSSFDPNNQTGFLKSQISDKVN